VSVVRSKETQKERQQEQSSPARRGQFQSRYDLRGLVDVVAAVARAAEPSEPERVSQSRYDAARTSAGYPLAPSAKATAARLKMPWLEILALALDGRDVARSLGYRFGTEEEEWFDEEAVRAALKTVALRLGKKTLTPVDYRLERERVLAAARGHRDELAFPTEGQVESIAGSWEAALYLAGLAERPAHPATRKGMTIVAALELCLETTGALPTKPELALWAAANGVSVAKREKGKSWLSYLAELKAARDEWGKWTPAGSAPREQRPDFAQVPMTTPFASPPRHRRRWTRDDCLEALARLLAELPSQRRLTLRAYQELARGRVDLPALSSLQRHGTFGKMVAEARRLAPPYS